MATLGIIIGVLVGVPMGVLAAARQGSLDRPGDPRGRPARLFHPGLLARAGRAAALLRQAGLGRRARAGIDIFLRRHGRRCAPACCWSTASSPATWTSSATPSGTSAAGRRARLLQPRLHRAHDARRSCSTSSARSIVTTARVKGVPERLVIWRHAFRPIRVPLITVLGLSYAGLLEGLGDDRDGVLLAGHRQLPDQRAAECRHERGARRDAGDRRRLHRHQQGLRRALPRPRPEGALHDRHPRDWLLDENPASRLQARLGQSYRTLRALLRNPLAVVGAAIVARSARRWRPSRPGSRRIRRPTAELCRSG